MKHLILLLSLISSASYASDDNSFESLICRRALTAAQIGEALLEGEITMDQVGEWRANGIELINYPEVRHIAPTPAAMSNNDDSSVSSEPSDGSIQDEMATTLEYLMENHGENPDILWNVLEDAGTDLTFRNPIDGSTPLIWALKYNVRGALAFILQETKEQLDCIESNTGHTALHYAVTNKDANAIQQLLRAGANPKICRNDGLSPFSLAVAIGAHEVIGEFLKARLDPFEDQYPETPNPAIVAIRNDDVDQFITLVGRSRNIPLFATWLGMAAQKNRSKILAYMIERFGRYPHCINAPEAAFEVALSSGEVENVAVILKHFPIVLHQRFVNNDTALMRTQNLRMLKLLLDLGLDPREKNCFDKDALAFAQEEFYPSQAINLIQNYLKTIYSERGRTKSKFVGPSPKRTKETDVCAICQDESSILVTLPCKHQFCPCVKSWQKDPPNCPICRAPWTFFIEESKE